MFKFMTHIKTASKICKLQFFKQLKQKFAI